MAITMDGIFVNGQKVTFAPEDILSGDASAYTEEIGTAVEEWLEENVTGGEQVTDTTLTLPGVPADAKKTGDEIGALKEELNLTENSITKKMILVESANKWNPQEESGGCVVTNGARFDNSTYVYVSYIPVAEGDVVRFYHINSSDAFRSENARFICAYDSNKSPVSDKGSSSDTSSYTVPQGIRYITPTMYASSHAHMITINETASAFIDYFDPYYIAGSEFVPSYPISKTDFDSVYMDYSNVNRLNPNDCEVGKYISANGAISNNANYYISGYIPIKTGETLYCVKQDDLRLTSHRTVAYFDASKNVMSGGNNTDSTDGIPYIDGAAYVRVSHLYRPTEAYSQPNNLGVYATSAPSQAFDYDNNPVFKGKYIPSNTEKLHVYLPPEIPVGVGRTIELYNELVCLEANKYHLHYSCAIGVQYARKFSITGSTVGTHTLTLQIFNDDMQQVWRGNSTIKVVANSIASELKVLPIGDSLTNLKSWLSEVQNLSEAKIKYIGTRGRSDSTIRHEGRSGMTAIDYNGQFNYTFDSNYQGNTEISGAVNPFWDGTKFSIDYYNTQQSATVGTADAIQLFLGTNDIFEGYTAEQSAQHIADLIDAIRADDENIPIFVCNTIYRSNQNGYYSSGGQGFTSARGWAFGSDMKIMNFQNALADALEDYADVYIVPLSVCMDRENDFGQVEVAVNPRLTTVTEYIPNESVHPQNAGYMQIADVMYSSYIAHLT